MNSPQANVVHLTPEADGWHLYRFGVETRTFSSLDDAAVVISATSTVHLSLPTQMLLLQRMRMPSADPSELSEMAHLQLEKTLPFPVHEVSSGILMVDRAETGSALLSIAVRESTLNSLCAPLRQRGIPLGKITPFAARVAAACPSEGVSLFIYAEQNHTVVGIADRAQLVWANALVGCEGEKVMDLLPQVLLAVEMEGVSVAFSRIMLAANSKQLLQGLRDSFQAPVELLSLAEPLPDVPLDITPASWRVTADRRRRGSQAKRQLLCAAALILATALVAFGYLGWLRVRLSKIDADYAVIRPAVERLQNSQAHWNALAPAVDPDRASVELLYQLWKNLPKDSVHMTEFDQTLMEWKVLGEASSAGLAIDYLGKLKNENSLSTYRITASPPTLLPNDQAQFSIFGKR